ncbi:MAG TPA: type II secretion system F family protein [Roseomonas sp.]|jgi:tight adherence protein B
MPASPFMLFGIASLLAAGAGILGLRSGHSRNLRERVRSLRAEREADAPALRPSIRVRSRGGHPLLRRMSGILAFNPEIPLAMPLPVVAGLSVLCGAGAMWAGSSAMGGVAGIATGILGTILTARMIFQAQSRRYAQALFVQLPDALGQVVRSIRAGLPVGEALRGVARETQEPTRGEFAQVIGDMAIGRPVDQALMRLHDRTGVTEYAFLATTIGLQSQTGGSLAETLDNLADIVRKRVGMAARARALSSEARASAIILMILPFLCAGAMALMRPGYLGTFWYHPTGFKMMVAGLSLMALGALVIRHLIQSVTRD